MAPRSRVERMPQYSRTGRAMRPQRSMARSRHALGELAAADVARLAEALDGEVERGEDEEVGGLVVARIPLAQAVHDVLGQEDPAHRRASPGGRRPAGGGVGSGARRRSWSESTGSTAHNGVAWRAVAGRGPGPISS